jgi:hypothetical protein
VSVPLRKIELFTCCLLLRLLHCYMALLERNSYITIVSCRSDENIIYARDSYVNNEWLEMLCSSLEIRCVIKVLGE